MFPIEHYGINEVDDGKPVPIPLSPIEIALFLSGCLWLLIAGAATLIIDLLA